MRADGIDIKLDVYAPDSDRARRMRVAYVASLIPDLQGPTSAFESPALDVDFSSDGISDLLTLPIPGDGTYLVDLQIAAVSTDRALRTAFTDSRVYRVAGEHVRELGLEESPTNVAVMQ